ncbi:transposase [Fictibacillus sp. WQ 8-8]|uniref:transposase n=1 Tax=Fictibacillus sp. WQ 8-8 TaxID=2938788 RepID=UPI00210A6D15|nr:transposase [Fictibacillus sp. WQ 8-8]MCQ6267840.1 transposase [Fictibacillus sp. WQ 8-8]
MLLSQGFSSKYHTSFLQYHISFSTHNDIHLQENEKAFLTDYLHHVSERHAFVIKDLTIQGARINLVILCKTTHYIPNIMKALKGGSARFMYKEFPESKVQHGINLWDQKYFIATEKAQLREMLELYHTKK